VLVSVDQADRVRLWQLDAPGRGPTYVAEPGYAAAFSPDGRHLAVARADEVVLLDAITLRRVARPVASGGMQGSDPIAFSPDSRYVAVANHQGVTVVDLDPRAATAAIDTVWFAGLHPLPVPAALPAPPFGRDAVIAGTVTVDGKPVAGAEIELRPSSREWPDARVLPARLVRSGKDGRYALDHVAAIEWVVTATSPDTQISSSVLDLRRDPRGRPADVALEPAVTLRGKVLDASGRPAPGTRITGRSDQREVVATDREGKFVLRHLSPRGELRLHARRADGAVATAVVDLGQAAAPPDVVVRLLSPSDRRVLRIKVVDASGKPVVNAMVEIDDLDEGATDARGTLTTDITPARVNVVIRRWPEILASQKIDLPQRGVVTLTARPPP
jgi:uncharacterized GH25 family protein